MAPRANNLLDDARSQKSAASALSIGRQDEHPAAQEASQKFRQPNYQMRPKKAKKTRVQHLSA